MGDLGFEEYMNQTGSMHRAYGGIPDFPRDQHAPSHMNDEDMDELEGEGDRAAEDQDLPVEGEDLEGRDFEYMDSGDKGKVEDKDITGGGQEDGEEDTEEDTDADGEENGEKDEEKEGEEYEEEDEEKDEETEDDIMDEDTDLSELDDGLFNYYNHVTQSALIPDEIHKGPIFIWAKNVRKSLGQAFDASTKTESKLSKRKVRAKQEPPTPLKITPEMRQKGNDGELKKYLVVGITSLKPALPKTQHVGFKLV